jgi:8-oxo-dGTP diphosphatase
MRLHVTARGILMRAGSVLVMQAARSPFTGLPGGHIDPGEQPLDALIREVREELGPELGYIEWLAKVDSIWDNQEVHESMDLYLVHTWPLLVPVVALENHLTARWVPWYGVAEARLRPVAVHRWIAVVAARLAGH